MESIANISKLAHKIKIMTMIIIKKHVERRDF